MLDPQRLVDYYAARNLSDKSLRAACYAPHVSLYFGMVGDVLACCQNRKYPLGNVGQQTIDEIWNGQRARTLRARLEQDDFAAGCQVCQWQISVGNYENSFTRTFDRFAVAERNPAWPRMMEFELSNTCNLECTMCYGFFSSLIRTNREHLPPLPKVYGDEFFRQLRPYIAHLEYARFYGGEPFLAQEPYRVWDMVVEDGLSLPCHVTTNGTQYNARVERVLQAMPVHLAVSLDAITAATYESIRVHASFELVMQNIRRLRAYCRQRQTHFGLTFCLMQQNWHEFGELLLLGEELDCDVCVNLVYGPPHCNLYALSKAELAHVASSLERQSQMLLPQLKRNARVWLEQLEDLRRRVERAASASQSPFDVPRTLIYRSTDLNASGRYGGHTLEQARRDLEAWLPGAPVESFESGGDERLTALGQPTLLGLPAVECLGQTFTNTLERLAAKYGTEHHTTVHRNPSHVDQVFEFLNDDGRLMAARVVALPVLDEFELPKGAVGLATIGEAKRADSPYTSDILWREYSAGKSAGSAGPVETVWLDCDRDLLVRQAGGGLTAWGVTAEQLVGQPADLLAASFGAPKAVRCLERSLHLERYEVEYETRGKPWQITAAKLRQFDSAGRPAGWYYVAALQRVVEEPPTAETGSGIGS